MFCLKLKKKQKNTESLTLPLKMSNDVLYLLKWMTLTFLIFGAVLFTRNMNLIWHSRWNTSEKKKKRKLTTDFWLFGKINKTTFWTGYYFEQNWEVPESPKNINFHNDFMNEKINLDYCINRWAVTMVVTIFKTDHWKEWVITSENLNNH